MADIAHSRKCRLALKSIANCYPAPSSGMGEHVLDVGGICRVGVDMILQLTRCNAELVARRYGCVAIGGGYRTDCAMVFLTIRQGASNEPAPMRCASGKGI